MISDRALSSLRCAAAVAHAVPGVRLRVQGGDRTLIEVLHRRRPEELDPTGGGPTDQIPTGHTGALTMGPCAFRATIIGALGQRQSGRRLQFMGLEADLDPSVSYGVRPSTDQVLTGGLLRLLYDDRWLHLLALIGDGDELDERFADPIDALGFEVGIAIHHDRDLEVAVLHVTTDVDDHDRSAAAIDALTTAAAMQAIAELEAFLTLGLTRGPTPGPASPDGSGLDRADRDRRRR